jgi:CRISPR system Cascade subunit CasB
VTAQEEEYDPGGIARRWWRELQDETGDGKRKPGNRAALAQLRRASNIGAMAQDATLGLFRALRYRNPLRLPRVATLASLLASIRDDATEIAFARAIGRRSFSEKDSALLKPLRFQRLVDSLEEEEILRNFRRAIDILGGSANVADLARIVLNFDDERTRQRLTFDYYGAGLANPDASQSNNPN